MAITDPTKPIYDNFQAKLRGDTAITDLVPSENIIPQLNPKEKTPATSIVYGFTDVNWDLKRRRGTGTLNIQVHHAGNKIKAGAVMALIRPHAVPKDLSGNGITMSLAQEQPQTSDVTVNEQEEFVVEGNWKLIFVEIVAPP